MCELFVRGDLFAQRPLENFGRRVRLSMLLYFLLERRKLFKDGALAAIQGLVFEESAFSDPCFFKNALDIHIEFPRLLFSVRLLGLEIGVGGLELIVGSSDDVTPTHRCLFYERLNYYFEMNNKNRALCLDEVFQIWVFGVEHN